MEFKAAVEAFWRIYGMLVLEYIVVFSPERL